MGKILGVGIVLMLVALTPLTLAEDVESSKQEETEIMGDQIGASIRLLQLEKAITKNIIKGEEVISFLKELEYNTSVLEAIIAELELVKEEVLAADPNSTDAVQIFTDLKNDSIELTKEFRDTLRDMLDDETIEGLRERVREMVCERVQNLSDMIRNRIRQYNRNRLCNIYGLFGENNCSLLDNYQNGTATMEQIRYELNNMISAMTDVEKYQIYSELKENNIRQRIQARVYVENATESFQERKEERIINRLNNVQNSENIEDNQVMAEMEQRMMNRLNEMTGGNGYNGANGGSSGGNDGSSGGNGSGGNQ